tara:strand:- start:1301 stop:1945 length:645 start_codon:yes stop_codon:yes gene_type:complete
MIESKYLGNPTSSKGGGLRDLNNTIVDTGLRKGKQTWMLQLVGLPIGSSNGLTVDVAGVSVTQAFSTDESTTLGLFATAIAAKDYVVSATVRSRRIEVVIQENKEVLLGAESVTGTPAGVTQLELEETNELTIVPGIVVVNSEDFEALRVEELTANDTILGYADLGSAEADAVWRLKRVTKTGLVTKVLYPVVSGTPSRSFDFSWTSRAGYTYA